MRDKNYVKIEREKPVPEDYEPNLRLKVEARLYSLGGQKPYFSVTGEEYVPGEDDCRACGCLHAQILGQWPELQLIVDLHLSDYDGVPMHAVENAWYWAYGTEFDPTKRGLGGKVDARKILAKHLRITEAKAAKITAWVKKWLAWADEPFEEMRPDRAEQRKYRRAKVKSLFTWWVQQHRAQWREEADEALLAMGLKLSEISTLREKLDEEYR